MSLAIGRADVCEKTATLVAGTKGDTSTLTGSPGLRNVAISLLGYSCSITAMSVGVTR